MEKSNSVIQLQFRVIGIDYDKEVKHTSSILGDDRFSIEGLYVVMHQGDTVFRTHCLWEAAVDDMGGDMTPRRSIDEDADFDDEDGMLAKDESDWDEMFTFFLSSSSSKTTGSNNASKPKPSPSLLPAPTTSAPVWRDSILGSGVSLLPAPTAAPIVSLSSSSASGGGGGSGGSIFSAPPAPSVIPPIHVELWRSAQSGDAMIARYKFDVESEIVNYNLYLQLPLDTIVEKTLTLETPIAVQSTLGLRVRTRAYGLKPPPAPQMVSPYGSGGISNDPSATRGGHYAYGAPLSSSVGMQVPYYGGMYSAPSAMPPWGDPRGMDSGGMYYHNSNNPYQMPPSGEPNGMPPPELPYGTPNPYMTRPPPAYSSNYYQQQ